jgi:hypothetical protein
MASLSMPLAMLCSRRRLSPENVQLFVFVKECIASPNAICTAKVALNEDYSSGILTTTETFEDAAAAAAAASPPSESLCLSSHSSRGWH